MITRSTWHNQPLPIDSWWHGLLAAHLNALAEAGARLLNVIEGTWSMVAVAANLIAVHLRRNRDGLPQLDPRPQTGDNFMDHDRALVIAQFATKRYSSGIFGTVVVHISVVGTLLAVSFGIWFARESTLSIHTIFTRRRETFHWVAILFTFALGAGSGSEPASPALSSWGSRSASTPSRR